MCGDPEEGAGDQYMPDAGAGGTSSVGEVGAFRRGGNAVYMPSVFFGGGVMERGTATAGADVEEAG